jgi:hypothetical protein
MQDFPSLSYGGYTIEEVLKEVIIWYPLCYREVDEDGARQAVLQGRPELTTFHLSLAAWMTFANHFSNAKDSILTHDHMTQSLSSKDHDGAGQAVVLVHCKKDSLTFLHS